MSTSLARLPLIVVLTLPLAAAELPELTQPATPVPLPLTVEAGQRTTVKVKIPSAGGLVPVLACRARCDMPGAGGCNFVLRLAIDGRPLAESRVRPRLLNKPPNLDPPNTQFHFTWYSSVHQAWMTMFGDRFDRNWGGSGQDCEYVLDLSGLVVPGREHELTIEHAMPTLPAAVKRVAGHDLTGVAAGGLLHLINSGPAALDGTGRQTANGKPAMKPFWEITEAEAKACLDATTWHPSITEYFPGGGWSTRYLTRGGMPATIARLNLVKGLGPALQLAEGYTVDLPEKVHDTLDQRTNPTWPTTWFAARETGQGAFRDTYSVMNAWGANHCVMSCGHIGADLISLASILRIPVYMHNVPEEKVFRPSAWNAFGTAGLEAADFRACQTYGPLYA